MLLHEENPSRDHGQKSAEHAAGDGREHSGEGIGNSGEKEGQGHFEGGTAWWFVAVQLAIAQIDGPGAEARGYRPYDSADVAYHALGTRGGQKDSAHAGERWSGGAGCRMQHEFHETIAGESASEQRNA